MPGISHIFLGIIIGLFAYYISNRRFTAFHVFVFAVNNILGPDVGWIFYELNYEIAYFIHTAFGFMVFALIWVWPFYLVGRKWFEPNLRAIDTYKLLVAGGFFHVFIDALGHIQLDWTQDAFWMFSFDPKPFFLATPLGIGITIAACAGLILLEILAYMKYGKQYKVSQRIGSLEKTESHRYISFLKIYESMGLILPLIIPFAVLLLKKLLPFGDAYGYTLAEAVYYTGSWVGIGDEVSVVWAYLAGLGFAVLFMLLYNKGKNTQSKQRIREWTLLLFIGILFLILMFWPDFAAGESDLGITYTILCWFAVPMWLLATSFSKNPRTVISSAPQSENTN